MATKTRLVAKQERFSPKNGDENRARRQKQAFLNQKWRRKQGSSLKASVSHSKMVTKTRLVAKNKRFSLKNGDENKSRGQKQAFFNQKWRRKRGSSPKTSVSHSKMVTKTRLVAKNKRFSLKNGDENKSRGQKQAFFNQKWRRKRGSSPKTSVSQLKVATKTRLIAKNKRFSLKNGDENRSRRQNGHISPKNGDENWARRQKEAFLNQKWRRERVSSPK